MSASAKHIKRLQEQNRLLAECLADERRLRKQAYRWYMGRLSSRFISLFDWLTYSLRTLPLILCVLCIASTHRPAVRSPKDAANLGKLATHRLVAITNYPPPVLGGTQGVATVTHKMVPIVQPPPPPAPKTVIISYELDMQGQGARGWRYTTNGAPVWVTNYFAPGLLASNFISGLVDLRGRVLTNAAYARSNCFTLPAISNGFYRAFFAPNQKP